jgi:hypothetical protein
MVQRYFVRFCASGNLIQLVVDQVHANLLDDGFFRLAARGLFRPLLQVARALHRQILPKMVFWLYLSIDTADFTMRQ